jgi:hypothetical protein
MSIYATIPGLGNLDDGDDPVVGAPWVYQGSHILPDEDHPRGGRLGLALIPSHITRDGRDNQPEGGRPWPWLRLDIAPDPATGDRDPALLFNPAQARHLAGLLTAWADHADPPGVPAGPHGVVLDLIARAIHRYDYHHALSGNDTPSVHHRGEAVAVLAALQGVYVPPPPGSDRDALPEHLRVLIAPHMRPYTSTACETARACFLAGEVHREHADELRTWEQREHAACRITRKQDMVKCQCDCHSTDREQQ